MSNVATAFKEFKGSKAQSVTLIKDNSIIKIESRRWQCSILDTVITYVNLMAPELTDCIWMDKLLAYYSDKLASGELNQSNYFPLKIKNAIYNSMVKNNLILF